jgi:hypothetical protein
MGRGEECHIQSRSDNSDGGVPVGFEELLFQTLECCKGRHRAWSELVEHQSRQSGLRNAHSSREVQKEVESSVK